MRQTAFKHSAAGVALLFILASFFFAKRPTLGTHERESLASGFAFRKIPIPENTAQTPRYVRTVHPSLKRISGWISSLGAAAALADLDGDGLPNDLCHVDPRFDRVTIMPVPGTGQRYEPFTLDPTPLPYDPATMAPMGCLFGDFNEDGLMDVLVYYWGRTPVLFLRKKNDSQESHQISAADYLPLELVSPIQRWYTNAATTADFDGDGHVDLLIANYFSDGAHILDAHASGTESMDESKGAAFNGGGKHFFLWAGSTSGLRPSVDFREADAGLSPKVAHGWTLAVGAADLDGDMLPEVYFANDFGPDRLLHNLSTPGHLKFAVLEGRRSAWTPASYVLGRDSFKGMGVDFADVNDDGWFDIYVSNITSRWGLEESHFLWTSTGHVGDMRKGIAPYIQSSEKMGLSQSGWGWDARLADFNNGGTLEAVQAVGFLRGKINRWPELQALGTANSRIMHDPGFWPRFQPGDDLSGQEHDAFFVRSKSGRYFDIGKEVGFGEPMVTRGIAVADVDGDGLLDFVLANQWGTSYFVHNESPHPGAFLGLHLLLPLQAQATITERPGHPGPDMPGRPAIGAQALLHLPGRRLVAGQVDGGSGHSGKRSHEIHFGLGDVSTETKFAVDLQWRAHNGRLCRTRMVLKPGWHTVQLGCEEEFD
ncbi:MAG: CRTAC1 family protein [Candidatus Sulfotelmatobacter sp.]